MLLNVQHWTDALGPWFGLAGSIFVVYGFLSERVIDFRFVIGRAAIYGSITAVLLLFFGILEWWAEQLFESTRPAIYLSLFAALFIGFSLNALHGRVEDFLNTFFFRDQRRAEEALRTASKALANTSSEKTLIDFLVDEPVRVLGLTSAALFLAHDGQRRPFERIADRGWNRREAETIDRGRSADRGVARGARRRSCWTAGRARKRFCPAARRRRRSSCRWSCAVRSSASCSTARAATAAADGRRAQLTRSDRAQRRPPRTTTSTRTKSHARIAELEAQIRELMSS